jgi:hypothetical protein
VPAAADAGQRFWYRCDDAKVTTAASPAGAKAQECTCYIALYVAQQ